MAAGVSREQQLYALTYGAAASTSSQTFATFHAKSLMKENMLSLMKHWKMIAEILTKLGLYGTVNYETGMVKVYEMRQGNPYFTRAGDFLDAIVAGFEIEDALILLTVEDIFSETVPIKATYLDLAIWLENVYYKRRLQQ